MRRNNLINNILDFFKNLFLKNNIEIKYIGDNYNQPKIEKEKEKNSKNDFIKSISIQDNNPNIDKTKELAEMLMNGSINIRDLKENEVNDMIDYFKMYITEMKKELDVLKRNHH